MSSRVKESSLRAVLAAANIVDVVSAYTTLRKRGSNYLGLCPFHQEKTPSFSVSADKGLYYCFGCGEGGDVVRFLERMENLSFAEAVEQLANRYGIAVEYEEGAGLETERRQREARLLLLLDKATTFYERYLWESESGASAREYLESRGLSEAVCKLFRVGLSPDEWRGLYSRASKQGFSDRELEEAGLVVRQGGKVYDRFRGRLMFPLVDHRGRVVGFGGRTLRNETPKYINSPEGPLYSKGQLLYGLHQARKAIADADEVLVVEGYTDVLGLVQAGWSNVVASMGTALTEAQLALMTRFTRNITFMFDADRAGVEAVFRSGNLARTHALRPMVAVLPAGLDPADVAKQGGQALASVHKARVSLLRFELEQAIARGDSSDPEGRVRLFERVRGILGQATSLKELEEEISFVADRLRLSDQSVSLLLREGRSRASGVRRGRTKSGLPSLAERILENEAATEREFLVACACHPARAGEILQALTPDHFTDLGNRDVFLGLREVLAGQVLGGGQGDTLDGLREKARKGSGKAASLFVRLVMEADQGRYSAAVLEELHLRLQEQYLKRQIADLRARLDQGEDQRDTQKRLVALERLLQDVRAGLMSLDPEQGAW